jgi:signal transduction histidine kinase
MIQNVLDFARIEQGRKQYQFEPTDLIELVRQTLKLMEPYAAERGVGLQFHSTQNELTATIDGPAIQQALINLIDNAIKHSPQGASVNVSIAVSGDSLILAVEDQGPGIPAHEHQKIFERFYRLGSELRRETPGVGIGLSIVKHVADAHRGVVRVQSEPGRGSRFILEIPSSAQQA